MLKRGGTKLSIIRNHHLYLMCGCGYAGSVPVSTLIEKLGESVTVGYSVDRLRCSRCGTKSIKDYRITSPVRTDNPMEAAGLRKWESN